MPLHMFIGPGPGDENFTASYKFTYSAPSIGIEHGLLLRFLQGRMWELSFGMGSGH